MASLPQWHHCLNGHELEKIPGDSIGQGSLVCCSPWACKEPYMTQHLKNNGSCLSIFWQHSFFHTLSELSQNSNAQADCHLLLHPHKISLVSELVPFPRLGPRKTCTCSWVIGRKVPSASCNHIQFLLLKPLSHPGFTRWTCLDFMTYSSAEAKIFDSDL